MSVSAAQLIAQNASCSLCGQALSIANPPTVSVAEGTYHGDTVHKAICSRVPFKEKHNSNCTIGLYYQAASNTPAGFISIIPKDLD